MSNKIREVQTIEDISTMVEHRIAYLKELQGEITHEYEVSLKSDLISYFSKAISSGDFYALLLEVDGEITSFGGMVFKKIPGDIYKNFYLEADILNMYTLPKHRRKGYSSIVLQHLITRAQAKGVSKLSLHTSADGEKLYRKFGFETPLYPVLERLC